MTPPTFKQQARRARVETLIAVAAPLLDLVLAAGDRLSRIAGPPDEYVAIRAPSDAIDLEPAEPASGRRIDD
jgi:hypothetical protein